MVERTIPKVILRDIWKLIAELEKENIAIERAILFGSHARGTATTWSDIDVALVSPVFIGSRFDDNCRIRKIKVRVNTNIHTHPYTHEDFANSPFVHDEILPHGISVK